MKHSFANTALRKSTVKALATKCGSSPKKADKSTANITTGFGGGQDMFHDDFLQSQSMTSASQESVSRRLARASVVTQRASAPPMAQASHMNASFSPNCSTSDPAPPYGLGKQQRITQLFGPQPPIWKTQKELLTPCSGLLSQIQSLHLLGE